MFSIFFTFLFVYALLYGVLSWRKPFGDNKGIYAIISVMSSFLLVLSNPARLFINFITPWFLAFGIFIFLIILVVSIFAEVKWIDVVQHSTTMTWLSIMFAIILIAGLGLVYLSGLVVCLVLFLAVVGMVKSNPTRQTANRGFVANAFIGGVLLVFIIIDMRF